MHGFDSISTWRQPKPPTASVARTDLVNVIAARHAGHADILREQLDGVTGDADASPPQHDAAWWGEYVATVEAAAQEASSTSTAAGAG